jgi:transposase
MKTMVKSVKEERFRWIKPILNKEISIKKMANICPFSIRTIENWLSNYRTNGINGLDNKSTKPKSHPSETPVRIKERVIELRK